MKALPRGHRISIFSKEERKQLVELLEKRPDMTLDKIRTHFDKQCSLNAVHKIVKALGFVFKKTLRAKEQERADIVRTRQRWIAEEEIRSRKAEALFLPAYSPDLNPIEKMWSKVTQLLRGIRAKTAEEIYSGIKRALSAVSAGDAQGWFTSCGYKSFQS